MASNPFGIEQVNVPGLLQTYEGVKRSRLEDLYRQKQFERQEKIDQRADEQYNREKTLREGLTGAYDATTGKLDTNKARNAFLAVGDIQGVMDFDDKELQRQKGELETYKAINQAAIDLMSAVTDQASYDAARMQAKALYDRYGHGQAFPELPAVYNPQVVQKLQMQALSSKERLDYGLRQAQLEEQRRHNQSTEANAAANTGLRAKTEARLQKWGPQPLFGVVGGLPGGRGQNDTSDLDY